MTDCPNGAVRDLLPDLLHGRLTPAVRQEVEAHVAGCDDCRRELALLGAMRSSLRRAPSVDVAAIAAAIPAYRAPARRTWAGWRVAAAVVILAAGGTSVALLQRGGELPASGDSLAAFAPVAPVVAAPVAAARPESATTVGSGAGPRPAGAGRELALASSAIGELSDGELSALLQDIGTIEALPSAEVENATTISPVAPTGTE